MDNKTVDLSQMMTLRDAADYAGYNYSYLRQMAAVGKLETVKRGNVLFTPLSEAERLKRQKETN